MIVTSMSSLNPFQTMKAFISSQHGHNAPRRSGRIAPILLVLLLGILHVAHSKHPHIVFILADDYGWFDIGYHNSTIKTPNLDQLASEGVKLENYYVQPICSPTRSQLMTGRYQVSNVTLILVHSRDQLVGQGIKLENYCYVQPVMLSLQKPAHDS